MLLSGLLVYSRMCSNCPESSVKVYVKMGHSNPFLQLWHDFSIIILSYQIATHFLSIKWHSGQSGQWIYCLDYVLLTASLHKNSYRVTKWAWPSMRVATQLAFSPPELSGWETCWNSSSWRRTLREPFSQEQSKPSDQAQRGSLTPTQGWQERAPLTSGMALTLPTLWSIHLALARTALHTLKLL